MSIGIRDSRRRRPLQHDRSRCTRTGTFDDSVGIYPEFIDGYGIDTADDCVHADPLSSDGS